MKTIKQIADEIGVSKTAVRKKIENLGLSEKVQTSGNRIEIDKQQERLIKSAFIQNKVETKTQNQVSENQILFDLVSTLQKELDIKNKQIDALTEANKALAQSINAERHNALAGTIQQQLTSGSDSGAAGSAPPSQPLSFWQRLLRKE